jgi:hypothetical protein
VLFRIRRCEWFFIYKENGVKTNLHYHKELPDSAWAGFSIEHLSLWLLGRGLENDRLLVAKVADDHSVAPSEAPTKEYVEHH